MDPNTSSEVHLSNKQKKRYMKELGLSKRTIKSTLKDVSKTKKKSKLKHSHETYRTNFYSKMSNFFMENLSFFLINKKPIYFEKLFNSLKKSNLKILSQTYVSVIFFTTLLYLGQTRKMDISHLLLYHFNV